MKPDSEWFEQWFDSPYYHVLYKKRDEQEAHGFLDQLISLLKPVPQARILDVACGKGRHSLYLSRKGFDVTGFDLSPENIEYDRQFENEMLSFFLHDMREIFRVNYYDFVFNLFSSFGYFRNEHDNAKTIRAHALALKRGGILVLDYMNSSKVRSTSFPDETKTIDGIQFHIHKEVESKNVIKKIHICDQGKNCDFYEQLSLLTRRDFEKYFSAYGLSVLHAFGSYRLEQFDESSSDRLILVAEKTGKAPL